MNRLLPLLLGPESVLTVFSLLLFLFCARHNSGEGRDLELIEKLIWLLPLLAASLAFATLVFPESRTWTWLARAAVASYVAIFVCGYRLIECLGSGSKGQEGAFMIFIVVGAVGVALGIAVSGAMILAASRPGFAQWFGQHRVLGSFLTLLSAVPISFALGLGMSVLLGILGGLYTAFKR